MTPSRSCETMPKHPHGTPEDTQHMHRRHRAIAGAWLCIGLLVGGGVGWSAAAWRMRTAPPASPSPQTQYGTELHAGGYQFINPLLSCEVSGDTVEFTELRPFKSRLVAAIDEEKRAGHAREMSVYFRDLNNGPWLGIDEKREFTPGSLLKVPLMMLYLKFAESDPAILEQSMMHQGEDANIMEHYTPEHRLAPGEARPVRELIERMIIDSDNNAALALLENAPKEVLEREYERLGIVTPGHTLLGNAIPVRSYASFFRILFNASYLSRERSEEALALLSRVRFAEGIAAGVPQGTVIAHKFGERQDAEAGTKQLHDCGIVYYPGRPYVLCMMSRGNDLPELARSIGAVSKTVWEAIDEQQQE